MDSIVVGQRGLCQKSETHCCKSRINDQSRKANILHAIGWIAIHSDKDFTTYNIYKAVVHRPLAKLSQSGQAPPWNNALDYKAIRGSYRTTGKWPRVPLPPLNTYQNMTIKELIPPLNIQVNLLQFKLVSLHFLSTLTINHTLALQRCFSVIRSCFLPHFHGDFYRKHVVTNDWSRASWMKSTRASPSAKIRNKHSLMPFARMKPSIESEKKILPYNGNHAVKKRNAINTLCAFNWDCVPQFFSLICNLGSHNSTVKIKTHLR